MDGYYAQASHPCNYCSKVLPTYGELVEHKKTHVGERPFSCHICNKRFTQKAHLNIHKRTHTGEKPYVCTVCHKRFAQSSHLNSHRRIHAGDRPFFCVTCNTGFSQKYRFDAHLPCMQQTQSRSSARISAAFSSAASLAAASAATFGGGGGAIGGGGGAMDTDAEVDQKPDIRYLESLNQQALIQQLAEFSAIQDNPSGGREEEGRKGLEEGEINRNTLSSDGAVGPPAPREEQRGNVSAACMPSVSSHRRKPAIIRHVDNEENGSNSSFKREAANEGGAANVGDSFQHDSNDAEFDEEDHVEPSLPSLNGMATLNERIKNGLAHSTNSSGPLPANQSLLPTRISQAGNNATSDDNHVTPHVRANHRISLVNFTAEELLHHLTSRSDIHRCDFCRLIFQDAAMYHIHRNMHDKNDLRCCNFCGKMLQDRYDFTAHFLNEHR